MEFFSALSLDSPDAHLVIKGEFDAFCVAQLRQRLDEAIDRGCIDFVVDASAVTFVDAGGLGALVRLRNTVAPLGGTLVVSAASPRFRQVAGFVGLCELFGIDIVEDTDSPLCRMVSIDRHSAGGARDFSPARQKTGTGP